MTTPATPREAALRIIDQALGHYLQQILETSGQAVHDACAVRWSEAMRVLQEPVKRDPRAAYTDENGVTIQPLASPDDTPASVHG